MSYLARRREKRERETRMRRRWALPLLSSSIKHGTLTHTLNYVRSSTVHPRGKGESQWEEEEEAKKEERKEKEAHLFSFFASILPGMM